MTSALRTLAGMGQAAPPIGGLVERWDDFSGGVGNLIGRTAQGTSGGWDWQTDNAALGNVFTVTGFGNLQRESGPGDGYQINYTDMGPGNINMLVGFKMAETSGGFGNDSGICLRGIDETNLLTINSFASGNQIKQIDNTVESDFAMFSPSFNSQASIWFRLTETGGTTLLEHWNNPANSSAPPTNSWDITSWLLPKFLTATKVGTGQWFIAQQTTLIQQIRMWGAPDPADLPNDAIGPIP